MSKLKYRFLISNGDSKSYSKHGGLPFNLLKAGSNLDFIDDAISLRYEDLYFWKYLWNFSQFLKYGKLGGWQYSKVYGKRISKQIQLPIDRQINILSIYPFLPYYPWQDNWVVDFYIDATTIQIFTEYLGSNLISDSFKEKIINREKINYLNANKIICRSHWAMESLINDYKINKDKIYFVPGGANLDINMINRSKLLHIPPKVSKEHPIKLGFIGTDWIRKGGPFLLSLADLFLKKGIPLELRVIGPKKNTLPEHPSLKYLGFIDKRSNLDIFINELKTWHFGTLFSMAEAFGISNRECLLLGVPVICHDIGGISSTLPNFEFGKMFEANPQPIEVYNWIVNTLHPYDKYISLRKNLFNNYYEFTWDKAVFDLKRILD